VPGWILKDIHQLLITLERVFLRAQIAAIKCVCFNADQLTPLSDQRSSFLQVDITWDGQVCYDGFTQSMSQFSITKSPLGNQIGARATCLG
jgi:hypothetical protein